tara:strand:- start:3531 stop:4010 length:480 start_codon:yes stop_codon:yes gene_type:complete
MDDFKTKKKFYKDSDIMFDYNVTNNRNINTENQLRNLNLTNKKEVKKFNNKRLISYGNFTAGRGLGNLDANNIIRNGVNSRMDTKEHSTKIEGSVNNRFDFLFDDKKQQAHGNINFNRAGESTRIQQLKSDSIFKYKKSGFIEEPESKNTKSDGFYFKY